MRCGLVTLVISGGHTSCIHPTIYVVFIYICSHPCKSYQYYAYTMYEDKHTSILTTINQSLTHPSTTYQCIDPSKHLWTHLTNYQSIHVVNIYPSHATINHPPIHAFISSTFASTHVSNDPSSHQQIIGLSTSETWINLTLWLMMTALTVLCGYNRGGNSNTVMYQNRDSIYFY